MTGIKVSGRMFRKPKSLLGAAASGSYNCDDMAVMRNAVDAVCAELGIDVADEGRRNDVARRILASYEIGRRAPLYLVHAGLSEHV